MKDVQVVAYQTCRTGLEWKMESNSECTQLQLTHVTGTAQSRLNYLVYLQACYLTAEAL